MNNFNKFNLIISNCYKYICPFELNKLYNGDEIMSLNTADKIADLFYNQLKNGDTDYFEVNIYGVDNQIVFENYLENFYNIFFKKRKLPTPTIYIHTDGSIFNYKMHGWPKKFAIIMTGNTINNIQFPTQSDYMHDFYMNYIIDHSNMKYFALNLEQLVKSDTIPFKGISYSLSPDEDWEDDDFSYIQEQFTVAAKFILKFTGESVFKKCEPFYSYSKMIKKEQTEFSNIAKSYCGRELNSIITILPNGESYACVNNDSIGNIFTDNINILPTEQPYHYSVNSNCEGCVSNKFCLGSCRQFYFNKKSKMTKWDCMYQRIIYNTTQYLMENLNID